MESIWQKTTEKPAFDTLQGYTKTDVLIIGGGLAGILTGYMLKNAGVDCIIAEAREICDGTTKNTTAKITAQHGLIYDKIISRYGIEKAELYLKAQGSAFEKYRELTKNIDCDFEECDSYVYSLNDKRKIERETKALNRLGCPAKLCETKELPFSTAGAVMMPVQAQFNPLKFAYAIARGLKIFEHTRVLELTDDYALTNGGKIKAEKIIVATHFPFLNKHGLYFLKMYQHRSYVLALENVPEIKGAYVDEAEGGLSFRSYGDYLLIGGGGHRTGKGGGGWHELSDFGKKYYPDAKEVCRYAAQDCKTLDDIPYIGEYSKNTSNLYVATGFNKWGMTNSMVAANILTDIIIGKKNEYAEVFSPSRSIFHKQLSINAAESFIGLIKPKAPRCTHLGCALTYNKQEHSWDCSCHGSRFTEDGRVIDNPATKDINE